MIGPETDARVLVATRHVDFRKGEDSLAAIVKADQAQHNVAVSLRDRPE